MISVAIIGAGPYGLSVAAHLRHRGIPFRIFGRTMDSWLRHMPKGMMLKSDGFASDIYDPETNFTLRRFCAEKGIEYADTGIPVRLETFAAYGLAFKERMVPELEEKVVVGLDRLNGGFALRLEDGETLTARRVVLAVGITHFEYVPPDLARLPQEFVSHSFKHHDLEPFRGRRVVVVGGGASATDLAGLLHRDGAVVQLVTRRESLKFHTKPTGKPRSLWQRIRHPQSGLGPGMMSRFFADAPMAFYYLPESLRLQFVRKTLGPSGGWFVRDLVIGKVPLLLGQMLQGADIRGNEVRLRLRAADGTEREILTEHVIAATGYKVNLERLKFLDGDLRSKIKTVAGAPALSRSFESSVPGLYFAGVAAANSFGPVMRFAFGAGFAAHTITQAVAKLATQESTSIPAPGVLPTTK
jgi:thioredoxin reductase